MPGKRWNNEEIKSLKEQLKAGFFIEDIKVSGKTYNAIRNKATRLELIGDCVKRKPWSQEEKQILKTYVRDGWTAREITKAEQIGVDNILPGRSRVAIQKQMQRMNLGDSKRSRTLKKVRHFSQEEKSEFHRFLRGEYLFRTPEELAKIWNRLHPDCKVKRCRVVRHLELLGLKLPRHIILEMPYSKAKRRRNRQRKRKNTQSIAG